MSAFRRDPYGCGQELQLKRRSRDPYHNGPKSPDRCPEMAALMAHCGEKLYQGRKPLPWEDVSLRTQKGVQT